MLGFDLVFGLVLGILWLLWFGLVVGGLVACCLLLVGCCGLVIVFVVLLCDTEGCIGGCSFCLFCSLLDVRFGVDCYYSFVVSVFLFGLGYDCLLL